MKHYVDMMAGKTRKIYNLAIFSSNQKIFRDMRRAIVVGSGYIKRGVRQRYLPSTTALLGLESSHHWLER